MPIPFRESEELTELGAAGFITVRPLSVGSGYEGALFVMNASGEPVEFTYNRVETPHPFLWRKDDMRRRAHLRLVASLLAACPTSPRILLCLADEISGELFCEDIETSIPICRVATAASLTSVCAEEAQDDSAEDEQLHLFWFPGKPDDASAERRLVRELSARGLLLEPFDRAKSGLDEVYSATREARS